MNTKLKLNQAITLGETTYEVIGVDDYSLINVFGNKKSWISYTLIDKNKNKTWISYGAIPNYFIQWSLVSEKEFIKEAQTPLNMELSGIANITFKGNPGFSTPVAELFWFNLSEKKYDFYVVEKFVKNKGEKSEVLESYYDAGEILTDFKV
jgi:hypothetical protein